MMRTAVSTLALSRGRCGLVGSTAVRPRRIMVSGQRGRPADALQSCLHRGIRGDRGLRCQCAGFCADGIASPSHHRTFVAGAALGLAGLWAHRAPITLPRSPASLSQAMRSPTYLHESRVYSQEILITSAKRLLQVIMCATSAARLERSSTVSPSAIISAVMMRHCKREKTK
jgi:hypothetical protein